MNRSERADSDVGIGRQVWLQIHHYYTHSHKNRREDYLEKAIS